MTGARVAGAQSSGRGAAAEPVPTGNTFDKYRSRNPAVRLLMGRFDAALDELLRRAAPGSVLDVGCGEGTLTWRWAVRLHPARVVGVDLADRKLAGAWSAVGAPNLEFLAVDGERLPFADGEFELVAAIELLEHVADPRGMLSELRRVAARHLLASVPAEPLWRALNLLRGAYVRGLGNTPGHRNHFSRRSFTRLLHDYGRLLEVRGPLPWTIALLEV